MEFGLISRLEEFNFTAAKHTQSVNATKELAALKENRESDEVYKKTDLPTQDKSAVKNDGGKFANFNEVILTNTNFGYNDSSKDFFVKVERGEIKNQYPTDEMMKMKAHLRELNAEAS